MIQTNEIDKFEGKREAIYAAILDLSYAFGSQPRIKALIQDVANAYMTNDPIAKLKTMRLLEQELIKYDNPNYYVK